MVMKKIYKTILIIIILNFACNMSIANTDENFVIKEAQFSSEYKKWLELPDEEKSNYIMPSMLTIDLEKENNDRKAYILAVNYISIKMRSIKEINDYLIKKDFCHKVINEQIKKHEFNKTYVAVLDGTLKNKNGRLNDYLYKDEKLIAGDKSIISNIPLGESIQSTKLFNCDSGLDCDSIYIKIIPH